MQKLLIKKNKNEAFIEKQKSNKPLSLDEIEEFYLKKSHNDLLYGLEYERISLNSKTYKNADYQSLKKILEQFSAIRKWNIIYDNSTIIALSSKNGSTISLEPGCQLEISIAPKKNILDIDIELTKIINLLDKIAEIYNVIFLGYGMTPSSNVDEIKILEKRRYKIMNEYLPYCSKGELCPKMMRKTAGIQINIDYKDKKDAYLKLKFFNLIMPFMAAFCANSPFENDKLSDISSLRAQTWLFTGKSRCNFFYRDIFSSPFRKYKNIFKNYIKQILNVPMIYIERDEKIIPIKGRINFLQFMKNGYLGYNAEKKDYILHQSLCFPDVRLKNYIEIRNHDSSTKEDALALCAFYKGLCACDIDFLINEFKFLKIKNFDSYALNLLNHGLSSKITFKYDGWDIITKLFNISKNNLSARERFYLEAMYEIIKKRKTRSDTIIDYGFQNAQDLVEFLEFEKK